MAGKMSRSKGQRGECEARRLLGDRDWTVIPLGPGREQEDGLVQCPEGHLWSLEVKSCKAINVYAWRKQAMEQARRRKARWLLLCKIPDSSSWLVLRQGEDPAVWRGK